jgi:hypothetical protein
MKLYYTDTTSRYKSYCISYKTMPNTKQLLTVKEMSGVIDMWLQQCLNTEMIVSLSTSCIDDTE